MQPDLSKVTIGIKAFLRPDKFNRALEGIDSNLPECSVVVADDSIDNPQIKIASSSEFGYTKIYCPFDSGFGFKSNMIAAACLTDYLLIGSDDFDFSTTFVRKGIGELVRFLDQHPDYHIASGRVNRRKYEFYLLDCEDYIVEVPVPDGLACSHVHCDLTVNYSLIRREVFRRVKWDNDVKIGGGEHGAFFLDCKRAGFKTAYIPGVNINTQPGRDSKEYMSYRNRALSPERPCFVKRGVQKYVLGDGTIDYDETANRG